MDETEWFQTEDLVVVRFRMGFSVIAFGNSENDRKERMTENDKGACFYNDNLKITTSFVCLKYDAFTPALYLL